MKLKWKVASEPTGQYRCFDKRGWPSADYPDGSLAIVINNTEGERYIPRLVKEGNHAPLKLTIYDYSEGHQKRKILRSTSTVATVAEAKALAQRIVDKNPQFAPKD